MAAGAVGRGGDVGRGNVGNGEVGGGDVGGGDVGGGSVGAIVGAMVGAIVGAIVGTMDGTTDGTGLGIGRVGMADGEKVGNSVGKAVGRTRAVGGGKVGCAANVEITGAAGAGGWGRKAYHHGNLPGAGHNEATNPKINRPVITAPSCSPSRLSLVYVPCISPRRASAASRCAVRPRVLSMLWYGADR